MYKYASGTVLKPELVKDELQRRLLQPAIMDYVEQKNHIANHLLPRLGGGTKKK
jgi:hypothetical protein